MATNENSNKKIDSSSRVTENNYDRSITPAETAARQKREGELYKTLPTEQNDQTHAESIRTTDGYTVDKEGLLNNYAIEPEMYYEVPGDAREQEETDTAKRVEELQEVKEEDQQGELTMEGDQRGKGPGLV